MYFTGIIIAAMTFLTIGLWHPIVIKTEYYFGTRPWVIYLLLASAVAWQHSSSAMSISPHSLVWLSLFKCFNCAK